MVEGIKNVQKKMKYGPPSTLYLIRIVKQKIIWQKCLKIAIKYKYFEIFFKKILIINIFNIFFFIKFHTWPFSVKGGPWFYEKKLENYIDKRTLVNIYKYLFNTIIFNLFFYKMFYITLQGRRGIINLSKFDIVM